MKTLLSIPIVLALLAFASPATAGRFSFGAQESIRHVADIPLSKPGGGHLYLGHKITMRSFLLPYYIESNGLVLGISGEPRKYLPLPSAEKVQALQSLGILPNPLPAVSLDWVDYAIGYSLWLALLFLVGTRLVKAKIRAWVRPRTPRTGGSPAAESRRS